MVERGDWMQQEKVYVCNTASRVTRAYGKYMLLCSPCVCLMMRKTSVAISIIRMKAVIAISSMVLLTLGVREVSTFRPAGFCAGVAGIAGFADDCKEPSVVGEICVCVVVGNFVCGTGGSVEIGAITGRTVG